MCQISLMKNLGHLIWKIHHKWKTQDDWKSIFLFVAIFFSIPFVPSPPSFLWAPLKGNYYSSLSCVIVNYVPPISFHSISSYHSIPIGVILSLLETSNYWFLLSAQCSYWLFCFICCRQHNNFGMRPVVAAVEFFQSWFNFLLVLPLCCFAPLPTVCDYRDQKRVLVVNGQNCNFPTKCLLKMI